MLPLPDVRGPAAATAPTSPAAPIDVAPPASLTAVPGAIADNFVQTQQSAATAAVHAQTGLPTGVLRPGDHSTHVHQLQLALEKLHLLTAAQVATGPGWYGQRTEHAVAEFQRRHHLHVTGVYDGKTRDAMLTALGHKPAPKAPSPKPAPKPAAPTPGAIPSGTTAKYDFFKTFVKAHGGQWLSGPNRMNLIGLREQNTVGSGGGQYHDVLYVAFTDAHGKPHVERFKYTTEPAANMRWDAGDANHDGRGGDLGRVPSGYHTYHVSSRSNGAPCLRPVASFTPERDINHDGRFTEHYRSGDGSVFLFHQGGNFSTGSAGCQTFPPSEWSRFWNTVKHANGDLGYTLTTSVPKNA